jgi:hypothetical protein
MLRHMAHHTSTATWSWIGCAVALTLASPSAATTPELLAHADAKGVYVSVDLHADRMDDLASRLAKNGLVSVTWRVELRRTARLWRDFTVGRNFVQITAQRIGTSDLFSVDLAVNGQEQETRKVSQADAFRMLTSFAEVPVFSGSTLKSGEAYSVAVAAVLEGGGAPRITTAMLAEAPVIRQ